MTVTSTGHAPFPSDGSFLSIRNLDIRNFFENNPTRDYMEIMGDWHLYHRGAERLASLAQECGIDHKDILIDQESEKVNVFLRVRLGKIFYRWEGA